LGKGCAMFFSLILNPHSTPLTIRFYKYHGAGNDFILIDNRQGLFKADLHIIARMCDRHFGIGADGLIMLNKVPGYDFGMKYYNSDGRESTMCGNGGRCITAFADFLSLPGPEYHFLGIDGKHTGKIIGKQGNKYSVILSMKNIDGYRNFGEDIILDTGSPHYVRFVNDVNAVDLVKEGRNIRYSTEFQHDGINVNFVQQDGKGIFVRTYERGVEDETLSCGTGVTASALAFAIKTAGNEGIVRVKTKGGDLAVHYVMEKSGFRDIYLEGPAELVFTGEKDLDFLR
jgi:diaminopimelate epimerase